MKKQQVYILAALAMLVLLFIPEISGNVNSLLMNAADYIINFEGFRAHPYGDYKQYSWGYGTKAPGPTGTITKEQAYIDLMQHVQSDYDYLRQLIFVPLNENQWKALLSFSYNEGAGGADNLVDNINNQDNEALGAQWALYNKVTVNGVKVYSADLAARRAKEWATFNS
jgi:lysozyme